MKRLAPVEVQVWRCRCQFGYEHNDSETSVGSVDKSLTLPPESVVGLGRRLRPLRLSLG